LGFELSVEAQAPNAAVSTATDAMTATLESMEIPGIVVMARSIKKAPSFGGSGLEKADFR
jgi:hypothetical protein